MTVARGHKGSARPTTLNAPISNTATSFTVTAGGGTGYPDGSTGAFVIVLDPTLTAEEKVLCSARSGDTFTVATSGRGYDDTTASMHGNLAVVTHTYSAVEAQEANDHIVKITQDDHTQYAFVKKGLAALRGAAGRSMRLHYGTDSGLLSVDDGTTWHEYQTKAVADATYGLRLSTAFSQPITRHRSLASGLSNLTPTLGTTYTDVFSDNSFDIVIPAQAGDIVNIACNTLVSAPAGNDLYVSWFSIGGSISRAWTDGTALAANTNAAEVYLAPGARQAGQFGATRQVIDSDIDAAGNITLRLKWKASGSGTPSLQRAGMTVDVTNHRTDRRVMLAPAGGSAWDAVLVAEPNVWVDATGLWHMVYSGAQAGFSNFRVGHATAPSALGPWTRDGSTPIIGGGQAGWAGNAQQPSVYIEGDTYYIYFSPGSVAGTGTGTASLQVASGTDLHSLTVTTAMTPTVSATGLVNCSVYKDGSTYRMMIESRGSGYSGTWEIGYATATSPLGPFTMNTFPVSGLAASTNAAFSGPWLTKVGSTWVLWYHSCATVGSNIPTDIYRATSTDLINWTPVANPAIRREHNYEVDQVADAFVVVNGTETIVFWSAMDNGGAVGYVMASMPTQFPLSV